MERAVWILQHYEALVQFSGQMLEAARHGRWDELVELERQRDSVLSELRTDAAQAAIPDAASERVAELIEAILIADKETDALVRAWRVELQALLGSMNTERKLSQTYDS